MRLKPTEHLENCLLKCKMHTQERQLTRFLYFTTDLQRKPYRTELEKSIPHIPTMHKNDSIVLLTVVLNRGDQLAFEPGARLYVCTNTAETKSISRCAGIRPSHTAMV